MSHYEIYGWHATKSDKYRFNEGNEQKEHYENGMNKINEALGESEIL